MLVRVSGHHVDVTPAMKDYASEKADRLARYFGAREADVTLKIEGGRHVAEFIVYAPKHHTLIAEAEGVNMYAAIDIVVDKVERQMVKMKEKWSDHHAKEGRFAPEGEAAEGLEETQEETKEAEE